MISFEEALTQVLQHTSFLSPLAQDLSGLSSEILAEDVRARSDLPVFSNSAMDGYALCSEDTLKAPVNLKLKGCIKAGDAPRLALKPGEAVKIMTGAPLPKGADAVVMVENTQAKAGKVLVKRAVKKGENIRLKGEEIRKGEIGLKKGTPLNPSSVGFLASLGYKKVKVIPRPKVAILVTGNELIYPGRKLTQGKIWDSNSASLQAALAEFGIQPVFLGISKDRPRELEKRIGAGLKKSDVLLISGGISVGDYDLVQEALHKLKVGKIFWWVAMKPGKPTFFGEKNRKLIFGLPGNPASVLTVFLEFVRPALLKMAGKKGLFLQEKEAFLEEEVRKKEGLVYFLKGILKEENGMSRVKSAGLQHSHILESFSRANCLIILDKEKTIFTAGERVKVHILPWAK